MLDNTLIEKALALTGKTMEDFGFWNEKALNSFFVLDNPKFCYYLLSQEFIEKYIIQTLWLKDYSLAPLYVDDYITELWKAICKYQLWKEKLLVDLLKKLV